MSVKAFEEGEGSVTGLRCSRRFASIVRSVSGMSDMVSEATAIQYHDQPILRPYCLTT